VILGHKVEITLIQVPDLSLRAEEFNIKPHYHLKSTAGLIYTQQVICSVQKNQK